MQNTKIKKYIFDQSARLHYYELLNNFKKFFIDQPLLTGIAENGSSILDIKFKESIFSKNIYNELFFTIILAEIECSEPQLKVQLYKNNRIESECLYYNLGESPNTKYFYMIHNSMDWPTEETFTCCVYSLIEPDEETISNYWRT